jgi:hypothetical protein
MAALPALSKVLVVALWSFQLLSASTDAFLSPQKMLQQQKGLYMASPSCPELPLTPKTPGNEVACVACG